MIIRIKNKERPLSEVKWAWHRKSRGTWAGPCDHLDTCLDERKKLKDETKRYANSSCIEIMSTDVRRLQISTCKS